MDDIDTDSPQTKYEKALKLKEMIKELSDKMYKFELMFNELLSNKKEWDPEDLLKDI